MSFAPRFLSPLIAVTGLLGPALSQADTRAVHARDLSEARPEGAGVSVERLKRLDQVMQRLVDTKELAGIVTVAARHGRIVHAKAYGQQDLASGKPMLKDAIFRIYSMTKPITGVAMMMLYEEGKWLPGDAIAKHIPEFANLKVFRGLDQNGQPVLEAPAHAPTMMELMTHTAGFTYGVFGNTWVDQQYDKAGVISPASFEFTAHSLQDMIDKLARIPLAYQPGTKWMYSIGVDIQGYLVERLSGRPFPEFLRERLFEPLRMHDTAFFVPADRFARLATLYQFDTQARGLAVRPQGPDPGRMPALPAGGHGLYSTAQDYLRFTQMLLNGGELDGVRVLAPRSVDLLRTNHLPDRLMTGEFGGGPTVIRSEYGFGNDFGVYLDPLRLGAPVGKGTYHWGGIAGTWFWIDPELDVVFVGMTQRWAGPGMPDLGGLAQATFYQAIVDPER